MTIPPFPSQDLAKLVLGYLAEEQLMTAYDEFLQASPYLDALRNEYDRIFMTSLKSILAEYRAVKIYVDTCKPFALRKKIFQCANLLDVVELLVTNVDINKIQLQDATDKNSLVKQNITSTPKPNTCEVCHTLKPANSTCKCRQTTQPSENMPGYEHASSLPNSVETTPLADLPGNHITTKKKHVKVLDKDSLPLSSILSSGPNSDSSAKQTFSSHISPEEYLARCENSPVSKSSDNSCLSLNSTVNTVLDPSKSKQSIEEFNNVLKSVVYRNKTLSGKEYPPSQRISNASTFQDFASGVSNGESQTATYNVPDSSTSENLNIRAPIIKDIYNGNIKGPPQHQLLLQVSHVNDNIEIQTCRGESSKPLKPPKSTKLPKIHPKPIEKKIKIISDVKVGTKYDDNEDLQKKPQVLKNATSTPLMQMQTIMINGTPAYKHTPDSHTFTKDEIMAMPTLIVVPASGPSQTSAQCEAITTQNSERMSKERMSPHLLGPLVIDVPPNKPNIVDLPDLSEHKATIENGLVKTVDIKNASVPKDNVISIESNTPQVLPPTRKSSSTPRRSSHVRVLDFTTPRRILHETINEQVSSQSSDAPGEIILTGNSDELSSQTASESVVVKSELIVVVQEEGNNDNGSTKENDGSKKIKQAKRYDWDADLRAIVANETKHDTTSHRKPKPKTSKKKKPTDKIADSDKTESKKKTRCKKSPRVKRNKTKIVEEEDEHQPNKNQVSEVPAKPTIKIICGKSRENVVLPENKNDSDSLKNKSHEKEDGYIDTPEAERLSLQNVIGAKLNLSDLLETPYKQALYDIQMETPKCFGPDLPDVPLSDIKIMNIPTPRFLDTPKPLQATPSSYSSRPTDYSSGGSYYKPDDQDFMPIPDLMVCPVTSSKEDVSAEKSIAKDNDEKKSRPVRKCTKNVSYYKNTGAVMKTKDIEDNMDDTSSVRETRSADSSFEFVTKKEPTTKTPRDRSRGQNQTADTKKKHSMRKIRKSPKDCVIKDKTTSFIKIKPRHTPRKSTPSGRNKKKILQSPHPQASPSLQDRKLTTKENLVNTTLLVAVTTKSRRKSSTPRKLHCTKNFNSESSGYNSPDLLSNTKSNANSEKIITNAQDSDTEQLALRWSDEGSQDVKTKSLKNNSTNEIEDITKIQKFIDSSDVDRPPCQNSMTEDENMLKKQAETDGTLQTDLMNRGFDLETAKIIERDLLDDTPCTKSTSSRTVPVSVDIFPTKKADSLEKTTETNDSSTNELLTVQDDTDDNDDIELSAHECGEGSKNYFVFSHDYTKEYSQGPPIKLKDNFTMEICIDDVTMRFKATPLTLVVDQDPLSVDEIDYSFRETERAVNSILNIDRINTPLKDSQKAQCYEIFDSTLTSLDTPLKAKSPVRTCDTSVTELVLESEAKGKTESKKRKRLQNSLDASTSSSKRTKPDADLLLKAANIQNIDIETVLTKLHGH